MALLMFLIKRKRMDSDHWFFTKLATLDTLLAVLMRYFIISFTFLAQSSISSLSSLNVVDTYNIISLFFSLLYVMAVCFVVYVVYRIGIKKIRNRMESYYDFTDEISKRLKSRKITQFYILLFIARRVVGSIWIAGSGTLDPRLRIGVFLIIQGASLVYLSLSHYKKRSLSIMEICHCVFCLILLLVLFIWVEGYMWNGFLISVFYFLSYPFGYIAYFINEFWSKLQKNRRGKYKSRLMVS